MNDETDFTTVWIRFALLCSLFCACISYAPAQDFDNEIHQARLFFDAGDYGRAGSQYKNMIDEVILPWQKAAISYNYGTALLAQGRFEEALAVLESISIDSDAMPLLALRLKTNIALARLLLANSRQKTLSLESNASIDAYNSLIFLYREVLDNIETANMAACRLSKAEGSESCEEYPDLQEMRLEAKKEYVQLLRNFMQTMLTNASLPEGTSALLVSAKVMLQHLDFLNNASMHPELRHKYLQLYLQQENSWRPLWEALENSAEIKKSENKEKRTLFLEARKAYFDGTHLMAKGDFAQSKKAVEASVLTLNKLLKAVFEEKSLQEVVQRVLSNYLLVLAREYIQKSQLQGVIEIQSHIEKMLQGDENSSLMDLFMQAEHYLNLAGDSLDNFKPLQARMYVEEARYFMKKLSQAINVSQKNEPEFILKNAVDDQELAIELNQLRSAFNAQEDTASNADKLLLTSQSRTVTNAESFFAAVKNKQEHAYNQARICQNSPWNEVVPLFIKGMQDARQAKQIFLQDISKRKSAMTPQQNARNAWKEALEKLQNKKKSESKENQPQQEKQEKEQPKEPEPRSMQTSGDSTLNDVLRMLQEMENDDRSKPRILETPANKEVGRPW